MIKLLKYKLILCVIILMYSNAYTQHNGQFIEQSLDIKIPFTITQYNTKHGLPQSEVADIVAKKNGHLIILTSNGIVEYNGVEFIPFIKNTEYKSYNYRRLIWHEKSNQLFAKELDGTLHLVYPHYKLIKKGSAYVLKNDSIYTIDRMGNINVADVVHLNFKKIHETHLKNACSIFLYSTYFIISAEENLYKYDIYVKKPKQLVKGNFLNIKQNPYSKDVYAISEWKIYKIKADSINMVFDVSKNKEAVCQDIEFIDSDDFFLATHHGLFWVNKDYIDCYTKKSCLPSHFIQSLYYNKFENCLFVGTAEKGLLKLQLKNAYSFYTSQGVGETSSLSSIIKTHKGEILFTDNLKGVSKIVGDTVYPYISEQSACASLAEIDNILYVGTWGNGVKLYKEKKNIGSLLAPKQLPDNNVHAAYKDSKGGIWIGTSNGVSKGTSITTIKPFLTNKIKSTIIVFFELKNGNLCVGGKNGIYILNKNDSIINCINSANGFEGKEVRSFYEDNEGKLWIGSYGGGIYCYFKNKLTCINKLKNSKLNIDAFCMAKDNFGYFYITSNQGLWRVKESDLNDFYYGKKKYLIPFYYGEEVGIINTEFNGGFQNNFLRTKNNHFFFPSLQGIVITTPEEINYRKLIPTIDKIWVNDTLHTAFNNIFNRAAYSIQFDFSCINFLEKYNIHFQYKLQDNNTISDWGVLDKTKTVSFKLLQPGKYTFFVRAIDAFNDVNPNFAKYSFEIKPYYYETLWFKTLMLVTFFTLIITIGIIRVQQYRRKAEEKELYKRTLAELELKAVQAQLNPHFIFNCLNTIKFFIIDANFEKANKGLNHFSKMLRDVINNSEQHTISLQNKITFLTDYLEL